MGLRAELWAQTQEKSDGNSGFDFLQKCEIFNFDEKLIWDHFLEAFRYADYEFRIPGAQKLSKMQFLAIFEIFEKSWKSLGGGIGRRSFKYQDRGQNRCQGSFG